jgi:hypothetical protein
MRTRCSNISILQKHAYRVWHALVLSIKNYEELPIFPLSCWDMHQGRGLSGDPILQSQFLGYFWCYLTWNIGAPDHPSLPHHFFPIQIERKETKLDFLTQIDKELSPPMQHECFFQVSGAAADNAVIQYGLKPFAHPPPISYIHEIPFSKSLFHSPTPSLSLPSSPVSTPPYCVSTRICRHPVHIKAHRPPSAMTL